MGWESRNGRGRYYTRSRKVNGRVVRENVGTGLAGELAAAEDAQRRAERQEGQKTYLETRRDLSELDRSVARVYANVETLLRAAMIAGGYWRPHRNTWRRRRDHNQANED